jgi:hypothetical protein
VKIAGFIVFMAGIVIAIVSTIPYLLVMVLNTDPMMSKPTPQIILFLGGGVLGFLCLLTGMWLDRQASTLKAAAIRRQRDAV